MTNALQLYMGVYSTRQETSDGWRKYKAADIQQSHADGRLCLLSWTDGNGRVVWPCILGHPVCDMSSVQQSKPPSDGSRVAVMTLAVPVVKSVRATFACRSVAVIQSALSLYGAKMSIAARCMTAVLVAYVHDRRLHSLSVHHFVSFRSRLYRSYALHRSTLPT